MRNALFIVGLILMALSLFVPFVTAADNNASWQRFRLFDLGLLLAVGSHGFPANFN